MPSTSNPTDEGVMREPEYPAGDRMRGPFSFGSSGFHIDYIFRESGPSLRRMLFSEFLKNKETRKLAERDASRLIDPSWIKAQLQYYAIEFSPDIDPFKAKALLVTSVAHGLVSRSLIFGKSVVGKTLIFTQCEAVPPQILEIKATLKEEYKAIMNDYHAGLEAYRLQELPRRVRAFEACATPTAEVKCDANLFLRKYFLDEDGNADRTKTPDLLLLPGYTNRNMALRGRTEPVPALHVADGGIGGEKSVTVIGWDRTRVVEKASAIDMEQSHGRGVLRLSQDWNRLMNTHREYTEKERIRKSKGATFESSVDDSFEADSTGGIYVLACAAIQYDWPKLSKEMRLRIFGNGGLGVFDLGIFCGLMVFGKTQEDVTKILEKGTWNRGSEDIPEESDEDTINGHDEYFDGEESEDSESEESVMSNESYSSDDSDDSVSEKPAKRHKSEKNNLHRLHFQWRGYDTRSGAIQSDPENRNIGYMDFTNDEATVFEGSIHMNIAGGEVSFQGYKIPGLAGPLTMNWDALSHDPSERAKAPKYKW